MGEPRKTGLPVPPGNALLLAIFGGFTLWYIYDAWSVAPTTANLVLIVPVGVLALVCVAIAAVMEVRSLLARRQAEAASGGLEPVSVKTVALMGTLVLYVALMPYIGFDAATLLFAAAGAYAMGERRPAVLGAFAITLTVVVIIAFKLVQPVPLPLLLDIWP